MEVVIRMKNLNGWNRLFVLISGLWLIGSITIGFDPANRDFGQHYSLLKDDGSYESKLTNESQKLLELDQSYNGEMFDGDTVVSSDKTESSNQSTTELNDKPKSKKGISIDELNEMLVAKQEKNPPIFNALDIYKDNNTQNISGPGKWIAEFPNLHRMMVKKGVTFKEFKPVTKEYLSILKHEWYIKSFWWWITWLAESWIAPLLFIYVFGASLGWVWRGFKLK